MPYFITRKLNFRTIAKFIAKTSITTAKQGDGVAVKVTLFTLSTNTKT